MLTYRPRAEHAVIPISFESVTGTLVTPPAPALIQSIYVIRTAVWNGTPALTIGKAGNADWLVSNAQANLEAALPAGESAGVEEIVCNTAALIATPIIATWEQGGANAGLGYIVVTWIPL